MSEGGRVIVIVIQSFIVSVIVMTSIILGLIGQRGRIASLDLERSYSTFRPWFEIECPNSSLLRSPPLVCYLEFGYLDHTVVERSSNQVLGTFLKSICI